MYKKQDKTVLVIDDDKSILASLNLLLEAEYERIITCSVIEEVKPLLINHNVDLVLMDMNYSKGAVNGREGLNLLEEILQVDDLIPVVVMTAYGEIDLAVEVIKKGAVDFIQKPWSNSELFMVLDKAIENKEQKREISKYKATNKQVTDVSSSDNFGMIGESNAIRLIREKIKKVSTTDANVLILGENGTGKELVAKAIHHLSHRSDSPFVKIDLGAIPNQLFEAELFGAKKGAYTGLTADKLGRIVLADKGSLFLDELGNLDLTIQSKLLSVLQNREVTRLGDIKSEKFDVRLISATNLPLSSLLDETTFRQDLLYRINTIEIELPPLRERQDDIQLLLEHFVTIFEHKYHRNSLKLSKDVVRAAKKYDWPGNIRELEHAVERAVVLCENNIIKTQDLIPDKPNVNIVNGNHINLNLEETERMLVEEALRRNMGNMTKAASDLGITRAALYRRLDKFNL